MSETEWRWKEWKEDLIEVKEVVEEWMAEDLEIVEDLLIIVEDWKTDKVLVGLVEEDD